MKRILSLMLVLVLLTTLIVPSSGISASAAGDSINTATSITIGNTYYGDITQNNAKDVYKFTISSSGKITINLNAYIYRTDYYLYDVNGNEVWKKERAYWNGTTEKLTMNEGIYLTKGSYYFAVCRSNGTGDYDFNIKFKSAKESFTETGYGNNNSIAEADKIKVNAKYYGQIAQNDDKDVYKFNLSSSGRIILSFNVYIYRTNYYLYDKNGNEVWKKERAYWNGTTEKLTMNEEIHLTKGDYYLAVCRSDGKGNYNFTLKYTSAKESFTETGYGNNNSVMEADKIKINTKYIGQIANNDEKDIYKFTLSSSGKINLKLTAYIYRTNYYLYDKNGNEVWRKEWAYWNGTSKKLILNETISLSRGTYYFAVCRSDGKGNYNFSINCGHKYTNYKNYKCSLCGYTVKTATLRKTGNTWYYYKNGVLNKANTLVKYNGKWYHVKGGKWVKDTTLVKYGKKWYYVKGGIKNNSNTIVKYSGKWYHVNKGNWVKDTTFVKYNGKYYYVKNGIVKYITGKVKVNGRWYRVVKGVRK